MSENVEVDGIDIVVVVTGGIPLYRYVCMSENVEVDGIMVVVTGGVPQE